MVKQMNVSDHKKYKKLISGILESFGATPRDSRPESFAVDSPCGPIVVTPEHFSPYRSGTVFCRYSDPDRANGKAGSNKYTGKCNYHPLLSLTAEEMAEGFRLHLSSMIS